MSGAAIVAAIGWTLVHFVWQGALIGCLAALLLTVLRNRSPNTRYLVACGALLACLAWPAIDLALLLTASDGRQADAHTLAGVAAQAQALGAGGLLGWLAAKLGLIVALWAACAGALALRMGLGLLWVKQAAQAPAVDAGWQARLSRMAEQYGLGREVRLRIVDNLASPITAGWWRPVVLVPAALVAGMPPQLLEALLAHELGHVKRHDYLVNLVQNVIETLLFYHPAVWWLSSRIRAEREQIADDFAATSLGEPRRLALALSELEKLQFSSHHLAQAANGGDLMARIRRLLRPDVQALNWKAAIPVLGLAVMCAASASTPGARRPALPAPQDLTRGAIADFNTCRKPEYPHADIAAGHQGIVTLAFLIDEDGSVTESRIARTSGYPSMDNAARDAIEKCSFSPALAHGRPLAQWTMVQYVWTLE